MKFNLQHEMTNSRFALHMMVDQMADKALHELRMISEWHKRSIAQRIRRDSEKLLPLEWK